MSEGSCEVMPRSMLCCNLCHEDFLQPKVLPCLHNFCKHCIEGHLGGPPVNQGKCPVCNTNFELTEEGVSSLPDNLFIQRLLAPNQTDNPPETSCHRCELTGNINKTEAACLCINCDEFLCVNCTQHHQEQNETSSHKVEPLAPSKASLSLSDHSKGTITLLKSCCESHHHHKSSMFCVNCDVLVCNTCQIKAHVGHRCADITTVAINFENRVDEPLADLEDTAHKITKHSTQLVEAEEQIKTKQAELQNAVIQRKEFLINMLENYTETVLAEVDRQAECSLAKVTALKEEADNQISSINAVLNFTDNLLAYGTDQEKVSQRKRIGARIRDLSEIQVEEEMVQVTDVDLATPPVTVEMICSMFGELRKNVPRETKQGHRRHAFYQSSIDSGHFSDVNGELSDLGTSFDDKSIKNFTAESKPTLVRRKSVQFDNQVTQTSYEADCIFHLDDPIREFPIPPGIERDCIKGMGINGNGDIIIGAVFSDGQCVYIVEKRGIIRGKIPVPKGWNLHSVASDGKVSMIVNRGENRYKVRILGENCTTLLINDSHIQTCGMNFVTATSSAQVVVASNRYGKICGSKGRSVQSGGNIAVHDKAGHLCHRITNENYQDFNLYVLEKPCSVAVDSNNNLYIADCGSHLVAGFSSTGDLLFTYGNDTTRETEPYEGPDSVALDHIGNLIVTDKRANRIDILSVRGHLKKTFSTDEPPKFVAAGLDKQLMVTTPDGVIRFYEY